MIRLVGLPYVARLHALCKQKHSPSARVIPSLSPPLNTPPPLLVSGHRSYQRLRAGIVY